MIYHKDAMKRSLICLFTIFISFCLPSCVKKNNKIGCLYKNTINYDSYSQMVDAWSYQNKYVFSGDPLTVDIENVRPEIGPFSYYISGGDVTCRYVTGGISQKKHILTQRGMSVLIGKGVLLYFSLPTNVMSDTNFSWVLAKDLENNHSEYAEFQPMFVFPRKENINFEIQYIYCLINESKEQILTFYINKGYVEEFNSYKMEFERILTEV